MFNSMTISNMRILSIGIFFLLLLFACDEEPALPADHYDCGSAPSTIENNSPQIAEFTALMERMLPLTTGIQMSVTNADGSTWSGARGYADIGNNARLEPCHRLAVASISKLITSILIMQLRDEGQLSLEDNLAQHLPTSLIDEIANHDSATLRQLLNHTSGIPDYLTFRQTLNSLNRPFLKETQEEKLKYAYGQDQTNAAGEAFSYSNTNYLLLGLVIESVTSRSLAVVVRERIANPLGLSRLTMGTEEDPIPDDVARPYLAYLGGKYSSVIATAVSDAATGDGGILSNTAELNVVLRALFEGSLVSPNSLAEMTSNFVPVGDQADFEEWPDEGYSLGVTRYNTPWGTAWGHTGLTSAYNSLAIYFPESGISFAYATNGFDLNLIDELIDTGAEVRDGFIDVLHQ